MPKSLYDEAQRLYPLSPCRCKRCHLPLPFVHHKEHLCLACVEAEIRADFSMFDLIRKEVIEDEETNEKGYHVQ